MSAGGDWAIGRWSAALIVGLAVLAGCSSSDDDASAGTIESTEEVVSSTSSSSSTTTTTTAPSTTATTEEPETAVADRLMDTTMEFARLYGECLADTASCDVDATVGPYLGEPFGTELRGAVEQWAADGIQIRGTETEDYTYRRHAVAIETPKTYALEVCVVAGPQAVYEVSDSGEETLVEDRGQSSSQIWQLLWEERPGDQLVINVSDTSERVPEGDSCAADDGE